jgi:hypothetical protein
MQKIAAEINCVYFITNELMSCWRKLEYSPSKGNEAVKSGRHGVMMNKIYIILVL